VCQYIKITDLDENSFALAVFNLSGFVSQQKAILFTENSDNNEFVYMSMKEKIRHLFSLVFCITLLIPWLLTSALDVVPDS